MIVSDVESKYFCEVEKEDSDGFSDDEDSSNVARDYGDGDGNGDYRVSWVQMFLNIKGNEFFCKIGENFIQDTLNLNCIEDNNNIRFFDIALDLILDSDNSKCSVLSESEKLIADGSAASIYGILHSRYILTPEGLEKMRKKYVSGVFGTCPRIACNQQKVLPVGLNDITGRSTVKIFCGKCQNVYRLFKKQYQGIDGAYFGKTFPHYFFLMFPDLNPEKSEKSEKSLKRPRIPRIYGFKIHSSADIFTKFLGESPNSGCERSPRSPVDIKQRFGKSTGEKKHNLRIT